MDKLLPRFVSWGKNTHNLKAENYVLFDRLSKDNKPLDRLKHCSKQVSEEPGYLGVFATNRIVRTSKITTNERKSDIFKLIN